MRHFKIIIFTSLFLLSTVIHADAIKYPDKGNIDNEGIGFGLGAIIGGLLAGPPGAVIGAAGGSLFGNNKTKNDAYASLKYQLQQKTNELALLQNEMAQKMVQNITQEDVDPGVAEIARAMRHVNLENKHSALRKISNGLSMSIYFRTNGHAIDSTLLPHVHELATLINNFPELKVQLFAHTDHRGKSGDNMILSKSRAQSVRDSLIKAGVSGNRIYSHAHGETSAINKDSEGLIFDRRVDIHLIIDTEV